MEAALTYMEEATRLQKELLSSIKMRCAAEMEYGKSMAKIAFQLQSLQATGSKDKNIEAIRYNILKSSLWASYADEIDQTVVLARSHVSNDNLGVHFTTTQCISIQSTH